MDLSSTTPSYQTIYDLALICAQTNNPKEFCDQLLKGAVKLCPFDKAVIYHFDENGCVVDQKLYNTEEYYSKLYIERYSKRDDWKYSWANGMRKKCEISQNNYMVVHWDDEKNTMFARESIAPRQLDSSVSFLLFDSGGSFRTMVSLDKTSKDPYSPTELQTVRYIAPLLNAIHRNLFPRPEARTLYKLDGLTDRELEVVSFLCQGMSPAHLCTKLFISDATVRKHLRHIYQKVGVSSQRELLAKVLCEK